MISIRSYKKKKNKYQTLKKHKYSKRRIYGCVKTNKRSRMGASVIKKMRGGDNKDITLNFFTITRYYDGDSQGYFSENPENKTMDVAVNEKIKNILTKTLISALTPDDDNGIKVSSSNNYSFTVSFPDDNTIAKNIIEKIKNIKLTGTFEYEYSIDNNHNKKEHLKGTIEYIFYINNSVPLTPRKQLTEKPPNITFGHKTHEKLYKPLPPISEEEVVESIKTKPGNPSLHRNLLPDE